MEIKSLYKKFLKYSKPTAPKSKVQSKKIDMSKRGLWDKNKNKVIVPSNRITMKGPKGEQDFFKRPVLATGLQSGKQVLMQPGREYYFPNDEQVFEKRMQDGGTVQTNMLQPIKKDEESLPIILESLFSQFQKSKEEFGVEPEESESMGTPSLQDGALVKDEDIRMDPIEINAELPPWYIRYPRKALRAANAKLEDWGAQYAQKISDATGGKDWYKEANPFGSLALEFLNAPQYTATYGVTGKVQTPSEAMDIQNPYGAFAIDAITDPMNLVGVGVSSKARNIFSQVPDRLNSLGRKRGLRNSSPLVLENNQLPPPPFKLKFMPDGSIQSINNLDLNYIPGSYRPDYAETAFKSKNISGLTKEEALAKVSAKDKDVVSKMSETDFEQTVLKPTGEIVSYKPSLSLNLGFNPTTRNLSLQDTIPMTPTEYTNIFNSRLDVLNDIIAKNNKSGINYTVKELSPSGALRFNTPAQVEKLGLTNNMIDDLTRRGYIDSKGNIDPRLQDYVDRWGSNTRDIAEGEAVWGVQINPGLWQGEVQDIANVDYFKAIPGLNMNNTTASVFSDAMPRRGTNTYKSINEYLKRMNLGRVKPGFNSQTQFSSGLWQDAIKKGNAFGYFGNPTTVYGSMRTVAPIGIGAAAGASQLQNNKQGMQSGGFSYTPPSRRAFTTSYQQPTRSTSDNTRVVTPNVSDATRAMVADQRAREAAAKRSGVIYAGTPESDYEKAKKAASFVEQSKLADGFATPLDYVLDTVNPTQYVFNATDLVGNQVSAVKNLAQGNFQEAGSDLLEAQMNALSLVPITKAAAPVLKPILKQATRYGDDVIQTSKIAGRPALPKYKDVYRAEHAGFNQVATPQDITGRWAANSADEASYYVQNLKDPTTGKVMNAFSGEQVPVRIMKQRVPEYKYNQQFAEGMPEEARIMSMGPGRLSRTELDQVLGPGATKRFETNQFSNQDLAAMQTAPFLFNPNEGILDAGIINNLRQGKNTLSGRASVFATQNQAADYLLNQTKSKQNVSSLNKYLPFNTFQMGGMSIPGVNGTVVASSPSLYKKYKTKKK